MITSKAYSDKLQELLNVSYKEREIDPVQEPVFNVDLNDRLIEVPEDFRSFLAVKGEHNAETIWFAIDRFFDGKDLSLKEWTLQSGENEIKARVAWAIQFVNALGEENIHPITWKNTKPTSKGQDNDFYEEGTEATLNLGWDIPYDITKAAGKVTFSLRCYAIYNQNIVYNLSTNPVTTYIRDGLNIQVKDNPNINPPKNVLDDLVSKITDLYENNSLTYISYENIDRKTLPTIDGTPVLGDITSADFKNIDYKQILNTPIYKINGEELEPGGNLELLTEADAELKVDSTNPIQNKPVAEEFNKVKKDFSDKMTEIDAAIAAINEELGNMSYIPIKIKSFTNSLNLLEKGSSYNGDCIFAWALDGNLKTLKIVNTKTKFEEEIENPSIEGETTIALMNLTESAEYTLIAGDSKNESSETTNIDFVYKLFYGKAPLQESYTEEFLTEVLNNSLSKSREIEFNANAGEEEYIYFCLPTEYGNPRFFAGGFEGGFDLVGSITYSLNKSTYNIWKTTNKNLGDTTVTVV